jgi:hypothetical protein
MDEKVYWIYHTKDDISSLVGDAERYIIRNVQDPILNTFPLYKRRWEI